MKPIPQYEDQYTLSKEGLVTRIETGRVLVPSLNKQTGYLYVALWKNNKGKTFAIHRMVAELFIPNPKNKGYVNHIDSDRTNPHYLNLEWATQAENIQHGYDHGFMSQESRRNFKDFELDLLLQAVLSGESMTSLAKAADVGLSRLTVNLRKRAITCDLETAFVMELFRQKCNRNITANAGKRRAVNQLTIAGEFIQTHESCTAAAKALGKSSSGSISNALNPNHPQTQAFGHLWTYK